MARLQGASVLYWGKSRNQHFIVVSDMIITEPLMLNTDFPIRPIIKRVRRNDLKFLRVTPTDIELQNMIDYACFTVGVRHTGIIELQKATQVMRYFD